jgi:glycosyltransferase involved in cell wall biosynthesis
MMPSIAQPRVALVVPAWNEAGTIGSVLSEIPPRSVDRVLVVCGGSTDGTAEIARSFGALAIGQPRPGYGAACMAGVRAAALDDVDLVAFLDGDYSDPPACLPAVLAPLLDGRADLVLGCRDLSSNPSALPPHARLGNSLVLSALGLLLGHRPRDLPSFKAIRLQALEQLDLREQTYGWTVELLVKAMRASLRIHEVSVPYRPRLAGRSKVSGTLRGSLGAAWKLCACCLRYARWTPAPARGAASKVRTA